MMIAKLWTVLASVRLTLWLLVAIAANLFVGSYYIMVALFATACLGLLVLIYVLLTSNRVGEKNRV